MITQELLERLAKADPEFVKIAEVIEKNSIKEQGEIIYALEQRAIAKGKEFNQKWAINYCFWEEGQKQCHQYIIYKNVELNLEDDDDDDVEPVINVGVGNITDNKLESLIYAYCTALERMKSNGQLSIFS